MYRNLDPVISPKTLTVLGASATRKNNGNVVLINLHDAGFKGRVIPVHPEAKEIVGYEVAAQIENLPHGEVDTAVISLPASSVADSLRRLDKIGCKSAIVMSNGFTPEEEAETRRVCAEGNIIVHGPNCMGLINWTELIQLYTAIPTSRVKAGRAAFVAQSGSAAISVMNSTDVGFSKVITSGSEWQIGAADFARWLATDDHTRVVGMVLEQIPDPDAFVDAIDLLEKNGKVPVVLKVGQSALGAVATQAHTGALIRSSDATNAFFKRYGIPTVNDYEELVSSMEYFAATTRRPKNSKLAVVGISGGEAALACDIAENLGVELTTFTDHTKSELQRLLPGCTGDNPVDFGASVSTAAASQAELDAFDVIAKDPGVGQVFVIQDAQFSLAWRSEGRYSQQMKNVAQFSKTTDLPIFAASSSGEALNPTIKGGLDGSDVPLMRGLRVALKAGGNMALWGGRKPESRRIAGRKLSAEKAKLREEIAAVSGPLPADLTRRLLDTYKIPVVGSGVAKSADDAVKLAEKLGFPLVAKVLSPDVPHRSDIGAVKLGIKDAAALRQAVTAIEDAVRTHVPKARIEGYELQEQMVDCVEAMVGFQATPPFGALIIVGTGGTMVELQNDRAVNLSPVTGEEASGMIGGTRLGALLSGYRNLIAKTDFSKLAGLVANLSELAADMADVLAECDLNPVLIRKGSGDVRIVDALFVAAKR